MTDIREIKSMADIIDGIKREARDAALEECEQKVQTAIANATVVGRIGLRTAYEIIRSLRRPG
jgi:hypothetical protein